jgi:hypothetical protein
MRALCCGQALYYDVSAGFDRTPFLSSRNTFMRILLAACVLPLVAGTAAVLHANPGSAAPLACHPSYPDFCIAPPPPDLDCGDIPARQKPFRVRHDVANADPHRFDRDRDGRACETRPRRG